MESSYLHSDMIFEILSRTSSDTLARCRLASKEWNQMTYESKFKKIRSQKTKTADGFLVKETIKGQDVVSFASIDVESPKISLDFVPGLNISLIAVSENNGIVLCMSSDPRQYRVLRFFVCKPLVELSQQIPNPRTRYFALGVAMSVLCTNPLRYKILVISSPTKLVKKCQHLFPEVFDSEAWKWKKLKDILLPRNVWLLRETTVVAACGAFHWLLYRSFIFSFDLEKEDWKIIPFPVGKEEYEHVETAKYEGKLALMCMDMEGYMHTWVLESYVNLVWKKRYVISMQDSGRPAYLELTPLAFYGSDILVVNGLSSSWLMYYDFKNVKLLKDSKMNNHKFRRDIFFPFSSDSEPCILRPRREYEFQGSSRSMESSPTL